MADKQHFYIDSIDAINYPEVDRVEVIDAEGRAFTEYLQQAGAYVALQDDGRTMKIFVGEKSVKVRER